MLQSQRTPEIGISYLPPSSRRQRLARRRLFAVAALGVLALVSGAIGMLTAQTPPPTASTYIATQ